ncbi:MAG TPA: hypothetical protein PLZ45_01450 [Ferruginibacter sp.]|nr:hypothetical protein [Chitinophagaceae bacterium]HRI23303.1 hypothetical protein [Ferruginibacter sp.]
MKNNSAILEKINKEELDKLARDVKETLAFDYAARYKKFSAADLWNIQRRRKVISPRRHLA